MAWKQADLSDGLARADTAFEIASRAGDDRLLASAGENLGVVVALDDAARGHGILVECVRRFRGASDDVGLASALNNLGYACLALGRFEEASTALGESILLSRAAGNAYGLANALHTHGLAEIARGRHDSARSLLEEALLLFHDLHDLPSVGDTLDGLGHCAGATGAVRKAVVLWAAADAARERAGFDAQALEDGWPVENALRQAARPRIDTMLGEDDVASAQRAGHVLGLTDAIDLALGRTALPAESFDVSRPVR